MRTAWCGCWAREWRVWRASARSGRGMLRALCPPRSWNGFASTSSRPTLNQATPDRLKPDSSSAA